jgi:hypothetical protein
VNKSNATLLSSLNPDNILLASWSKVTPFSITVLARWSSSPFAANSLFTLSLTSSLLACWIIYSFSFTILSKSSGNSYDRISDQFDSTGESGHPTSDIDFILNSTLSPDWIGISNWFIFGISGFSKSSTSQ